MANEDVSRPRGATKNYGRIRLAATPSPSDEYAVTLVHPERPNTEILVGYIPIDASALSDVLTLLRSAIQSSENDQSVLRQQISATADAIVRERLNYHLHREEWLSHLLLAAHEDLEAHMLAENDSAS